MVQNDRFLSEVQGVLAHYPTLRRMEKDGVTIIAGELVLKDDKSDEIDRYNVEIHPTSDYPNSYPLVYEVGGRIPINIDWHIYSSGACCLAVPAEERLDCIRGINLVSFIEKQVTGFFFNQTFRRKNGYFYRERAHGLTGRLQYYQEHLMLPTIEMAITGLEIIATGRGWGSHKKCLCGSNRKFKKCHRRSLRNLGKKAADLVKADYLQIKDIIARARKQTVII